MTANKSVALDRFPVVAGGVLGLLAVILGAYGAHGLKAVLLPAALSAFQTGVTYQMYHAIALLALAALPGFGFSRVLLRWACRLWLIGVMLFSGSIYLLVLTEMKWLGPVTPVGGLSLIVGWMLVVIAGVQKSEAR